MAQPTVEELRAQVEAAKKQAMRNFAATWGTDDVGRVFGALRQTIPGSKSPAHAATMARRMIAEGC